VRGDSGSGGRIRTYDQAVNSRPPAERGARSPSAAQSVTESVTRAKIEPETDHRPPVSGETPGAITSCLVEGCDRPLCVYVWCAYHARRPSPSEGFDLRPIERRLSGIAGTLRIIAASRLVESGRAESWEEAVKIVRENVDD
jgi:hypothetical protein